MKFLVLPITAGVARLLFPPFYICFFYFYFQPCFYLCFIMLSMFCCTFIFMKALCEHCLRKVLSIASQRWSYQARGLDGRGRTADPCPDRGHAPHLHADGFSSFHLAERELKGEFPFRPGQCHVNRKQPLEGERDLEKEKEHLHKHI